MIALVILITTLMFGENFITEGNKTDYLTSLTVLAITIGLDFFFWLAVFVLWRDILEESSESSAQLDDIGELIVVRTVRSIEL